MAERPIKAHLETLVTPEFNNPDTKELMKYMDNMINTYLNETESMMINVVEYGFNNGNTEGTIVGYVRMAVWKPIGEKTEDAPQEDTEDNNDVESEASE